MLNWWLGRPVGTADRDDQYAITETPETPAPVFAVRALKSVLFGAPDLLDDTTIMANEEEKDKAAKKDELTSQAGIESPTKRNGILVTPGTATTRRKTVSFGAEVENNEGRGLKAGRSVLPSDFPGKFPSPWSSNTESRRKSSLTRAFEASREGKPRKSSSADSSNASKSTSSTNANPDAKLGEEKSSQSGSGHLAESQTDQALMQDLLGNDEDLGDMTIDLNEPHSQSGKYWKSEFEGYHEEAKREMRKLVRYKHLAKSYAQKKDEEALDLAERLEEEQRKVARLEGTLAKRQLAAQAGRAEDSSKIEIELVRQTALASEYRIEIEQLRSTLQAKDNPIVNMNSTESQLESSRMQRDQDSRMAPLQAELDSVRRTLSAVERDAEKLCGVNEKLSQDLRQANVRHEKHLEQCEKRKQASDEQRQKMEDMVQNLQKSYDNMKELAKSNRRDAEQLLKKRHDQVVELRKEIASLKDAPSKAREPLQILDQKTADHDRIVEGYEKDITQLKEGKLGTKDSSGLSSQRQRDQQIKLSRKSSKKENAPVLEVHIATSDQSIPGPSTVPRSSRLMLSETPSGSPAMNVSRSALSEITNEASRQTASTQNEGRWKDGRLTNRHSDTLLDSPKLDLPSRESSFSIPPAERAVNDQKIHRRPQSLMNIASSPSKLETVLPHPYQDLRPPLQKALPRYRQANPEGTRRSTSLESSKTRCTLPPERAAAAKARLEQRMAERKRSSAMG